LLPALFTFAPLVVCRPISGCFTRKDTTIHNTFETLQSDWPSCGKSTSGVKLKNPADRHYSLGLAIFGVSISAQTNSNGWNVQDNCPRPFWMGAIDRRLRA